MPAIVDVETRDPDTGFGHIRELLGSQLRNVHPASRFQLRIRALAADDVAATRLVFGGELHVETPPTGTIIVARVNSGRYRMRLGKDEIVPGQRLFCLRSDRPQAADFDNLDIQALAISPDALAQTARSTAGNDAFHLELEGHAARSDAMERHWVATARFLTRNVLSNGALSENPVVLGQALRSLMMMTLQTFPNNTLELDLEREEHAAAPAVRRAVEFIDENLDEDISVQQIADAARMSVRGLQAAFRRQLETTPLAYLRRARLDAARVELQERGEGVTVESVALRWGFGHPGRFAHSYHDQFGEMPSETRAR